MNPNPSAPTAAPPSIARPGAAGATDRPSEEEWARSLDVASRLRVAVFVVAYNAEAHIEETLRRIPRELAERLTSIYVIDDSSRDETSRAATDLKSEIPTLDVFRTPYNQGYGGNQKLGYQYAMKQGFDVVVLRRGSSPVAGHVGFYAGSTGTVIHVLGGNQGDTVSIATFSLDDLLGLRRLQ